MKFLFLLLFISGCSSLYRGTPKEGKTTYSYVDAGGTFKLVRETKKIQKKLVTRVQLIDNRGGKNKVVEKSILVSQLGSVKNKKQRLATMRPYASEFTVWLEGKKYHSRFKLDPKNKAMALSLDSPDPRWQGKSSVKFPKGLHFCFYNQIPECLYHNYLLIQAQENKERKYDFYLVWDNHPFVQDQLTRIGKNLFSHATVKFDGVIKGLFRYIIEVEGQMILYQFSKSFDLVKIAWISQGITVAPPGQEIVED